MGIRSAQVTDLAHIDQIYTEGMQLSLQGEGATQPIRLWQMVSRTLSSLLPISTPSDLLFVLEDDDTGRVMGFIQGEFLGGSDLPVGGARRSPVAVRVLNLSLSRELSGAGGGALIDHLCGEALERGVSRVYVRIPDGHAIAESFKAQGFQRYADERVFYRASLIDDAPNEPIGGLRPLRKKDMLGLFTLYLAVTPKPVSQMEAPDFEQWRAVHLAEWLERFSRRNARSLAVERDGEIVGWLGVALGQPGRPHTIAMLARGDLKPAGALQRQLLGAAMGELGPHPGPAWINVRNYDTVTTRVLQDADFEALAGQELLVREMRARATARERAPRKEKALAPVFSAVPE